MTENLPAPLDLDAAFRRAFIASAHEVAAMKNEPTWPERIWSEGVRLMPDDAPWWAGIYPSSPDLHPDLSVDETNDRADREAHADD